VDFLVLRMYFFYVDESGNPEGHHEPLLNGETPLFSLNSLVVKEEFWRDLDRDYHKLKKRFFQQQIGTREAQYWEIKGNELTGHHNRDNRRNHAFIEAVLNLCVKYNGKLFSIIFIKNSINPTNKTSLYTMVLQYLVERFQSYLEEPTSNDKGIIIIDSRIHNLNLDVAKSHLSFVFGHNTGKSCDRIIEAPMFADSRLSAGLQITDIVGSCIFTNFYHRNSMFVTGAIDYSHMAMYWEKIDAIQYKGTILLDGHIKNGFRVIDFLH
jgi:hypothetical protein